MSKAKIFYFTLQDEQTKEEKLDWFDRTPIEKIAFEEVNSDTNHNWINLTDNDFDSFLPLIDKRVKAGKSKEAVFELFSRGVATQRDEWVYAFSSSDLDQKMKYFVKAYQHRIIYSEKLSPDIKWDRELEKYFDRRIHKDYEQSRIVPGSYRPFCKRLFYFDKHFNGMTYQMPDIFPGCEANNKAIFCTDVGTQSPFMVTTTDFVPDVHLVGTAAQCLPLYRYDENGDRIDNITDWGLTQFQTHYADPTITKLHIFHYSYAILHHPAYRTKYELNLKREFPRLPFYADFHQWATWGQALMDLHLNYETIEPYGLQRVDQSDSAVRANNPLPLQVSLLSDVAADYVTKPAKIPKAKLKADKTNGHIILDTETTLTGVPTTAWDYKLGNRSALEWILDQYKEKKPKDPTIRELFNTYKFANYKEHVIDLLQRVCTVSIRTMTIIDQMPNTVEHQTEINQEKES